MSDYLDYRSEFLVKVFEKYIDKNDSILEIGHNDGRNIEWLKQCGWKNAEGIDKKYGKAIEDVEPKKYDTIFTMSCLFTIAPQDEWVFEKIASMTSKYLITIEGETTSIGAGVIGRDYSKIFCPLGFNQVACKHFVFNEFGVLRVFKKNEENN